MLEAIVNRDFLQYTAAVFVVVYGLTSIIQWFNDERKIRALGGHAPIRRTYLPFGIDFVIPFVRSVNNHTNGAYWQELFRQHGSHTVEGNIGGRRLIFTDDPENIKAVLATQFDDFGHGETFHREWQEFLGDSIFTTDKEEWHASRQLIRPMFIKDRVSDLDTFERHVEVLLGKMGGGGQVVDMKDLCHRYTLDAATDFLLGCSVGSLDNPQVRFAEAFAEISRVQGMLARVGDLGQFYPKWSHRRNIKVLNEFVQQFIEQALRLSPEELEKRTRSDKGYTFLHALAGFTRDPKVIRDQIVAVLLAGRDTTACTLSLIFYELSRHPDIVRKVRDEILSTVGPTQRPSYDDMKSMKYLQYVMNETLRLYPIIPFNLRCSFQDTTLPRGGGPDGTGPVGILKNTFISYSPFTMQRRPELYPATPPFPPILDFCPERWTKWTPTAWHYIPFNGGPRICIGQQFALTEMAYVIVRVFQRFERVESRMSPEQEENMPLKSDIVLQPSEEVKVAFWESGMRENGQTAWAEKSDEL